MAEVIGFVAGKGGMGKTALCAEIARNLAAAGRKVLCVDCHRVYGDLDAYLRLEPVPHLSYTEVCQGLFPLEKATAHPFFPKLRFLAAPANRTQPEKTDLSVLLRQAGPQFDYILLDDPADEVAADRYILVTHPNPAAIHGARRKADALEVQGKTNIRLIVNSIERKQMAQLGLNVDDVMDQVGLPLLGIVPYDWDVTVACAHGKDPAGKKGAAAAAERIARRLQGQTVAIPTRVL